MSNGIVFEIQHFTVHDGPGIRTTVFLKGCQLRCLWCHNPESILPAEGELAFLPGKCVGCGQCFRVCPEQAHFMENGVHRIDREKCVRCGRCAEVCIGNALSLSGRRMTPEQVFAEVCGDLPYYRESGGGVTISGGEPLMQPEFVKELLELCKTRKIHTAIETNLCYPYSRLDGIREQVDLFLVDWKESDSRRHKEYTGMGNEQIYDNIRRLCRDGHSVLLRCPIIPGYNAREDHLKRIAGLTQEFPELLGAELMPYHSLGVGKIDKFGLEGKIRYIRAEEPSRETVRQWIAQCAAWGGRIINEKE